MRKNNFNIKVGKAKHNSVSNNHVQLIELSNYNKINIDCLFKVKHRIVELLLQDRIQLDNGNSSININNSQLDYKDRLYKYITTQYPVWKQYDQLLFNSAFEDTNSRYKVYKKSGFLKDYPKNSIELSVISSNKYSLIINHLPDPIKLSITHLSKIRKVKLWLTKEGYHISIDKFYLISS